MHIMNNYNASYPLISFYNALYIKEVKCYKIIQSSSKEELKF